MNLKPFSTLNCVAAYRKHGQRYAIFTFGKSTFLLSNVVLSITSFIASNEQWGMYYECYDVAMLMIKAALVLLPYLVLETVYWRYRIWRERLAPCGRAAIVAEQT